MDLGQRDLDPLVGRNVHACNSGHFVASLNSTRQRAETKPNSPIETQKNRPRTGSAPRVRSIHQAMERDYLAIPLDKVNWPAEPKTLDYCLFYVQCLIYLFLNRRNIGHAIDGPDLTLRCIIPHKRLCLIVICLQSFPHHFLGVVFAPFEFC